MVEGLTNSADGPLAGTDAMPLPSVVPWDRAQVQLGPMTTYYSDCHWSECGTLKI